MGFATMMQKTKKKNSPMCQKPIMVHERSMAKESKLHSSKKDTMRNLSKLNNEIAKSK